MTIEENNMLARSALAGTTLCTYLQEMDRDEMQRFPAERRQIQQVHERVWRNSPFWFMVGCVVVVASAYFGGGVSLWFTPLGGFFASMFAFVNDPDLNSFYKDRCRRLKRKIKALECVIEKGKQTSDDLPQLERAKSFFRRVIDEYKDQKSRLQETPQVYH